MAAVAAAGRRWKGQSEILGVPKSVVSAERLLAVRKKSRLASSAAVSPAAFKERSGLKSNSSIVA